MLAVLGETALKLRLVKVLVQKKMPYLEKVSDFYDVKLCGILGGCLLK